ncbi:MAG: ABC transporter transmembrane domain-containing protein, partial [Methyloligellaceae bacterium]
MAKVNQTDPEVRSDRRFRRTATVDHLEGLGAVTRITRMTFRYPVRVCLALVATVAAAVVQLSIPVILGRAVDQAQTMTGSSEDRSALIMIALTLLAVSVARGLFTLIQNYAAESVGHALARDLRNAIYDKILRLPFSFHDRTHSGDLITVGMLDLEGVRMYFSTA